MPGPLESLLRPLTRVLNRNIAEITPARQLAAQLAGKTVAIRVRDTALSMYFMFDEELVVLRTDYSGEPDVAITGSLLTLGRMLGGGGEAAIRGGQVELTGDAATAQQFEKLLRLAKPDMEEELSQVVGDAAAFRMAEAVRGISSWMQEARTVMGGNIREFLQEESRDAPTRFEVERFADRVGTLRDDVERLAARIARLENSQ